MDWRNANWFAVAAVVLLIVMFVLPVGWYTLPIGLAAVTISALSINWRR